MQLIKISQLQNSTENNLYVLQVDGNGEIVANLISVGNLSSALRDQLVELGKGLQLGENPVDLEGIDEEDVLQFRDGVVTFVPVSQLGLGRIGDTDVVLTSVAEGDIIQYKTGKFVNVPLPDPAQTVNIEFNSDLDTFADLYITRGTTLQSAVTSSRIQSIRFQTRIDQDPIVWLAHNTLPEAQTWLNARYADGYNGFYLRVVVVYNPGLYGNATVALKYKA